LDPSKKRLWRGEQEIELQPRPLAVLHYLVDHPGRVVPKEELLKQVWLGTYVTKTALKVCIRAIRKALGEDATTPRYIETVGQLGYRFLAEGDGGEAETPGVVASAGNRPIVGRDREVDQLQEWLRHMRSGARQVVFVTGEPGIGKTTLIDVFLDTVRAMGQMWIGQGQCLEQYGEGEAYLPVLEAFGRLCREPGGEQLVAVLAQYAPTWLVQMPALVSAAELEILQRKVTGATRERMLREMAEAVEALTAERGLVLVFEDLQWSDHSTLGLITYLARRREPARLMVIGTYRPTDVMMREHPLKGIKQELHVHGYCEEIRLGLLTEEDVAEYVAGRFAGEAQESLPELARLIYRRTDGNALFMVNLVNELVAQHVIVQGEGRWELRGTIADIEKEIPSSIRQFIEQQIDRLSPKEREVLEVASVVGAEFSAAAVAAGLEADVAEVERRCADLVRREQFLRTNGSSAWPDGTVASRYSFVHTFYREVVYERVTEAWRAQLHRRIGEREEAGYGEQAREIAAELAVHFEQGRDYPRAVRYLQLTGENAIRRSAYQEALDHLNKGLELLKLLPDTAERTPRELALLITLGASLMATKGFAVPEVGQAYARARELCQKVGETPQLFPVLWGLWAFYEARAELKTARELGEQLLILAQSRQDSALILEAHHALWTTSLMLGELAQARAHSEQGVALYSLQQHCSLAFLYGGHDPGVCCRCTAAFTLWYLGYPDQALQRSHEALALAQELAHPRSLAEVLASAAQFHRLRREGQAVQEQAEMLVALSDEQGFLQSLEEGTILRGWALAEQGRVEEGIAQMCQGLAAIQAMESHPRRVVDLARLAEAYGKAGQAEEGLNMLAEALTAARKSGRHFYGAELYRLKGELTLQKCKVQGSKFKVANLQAEAEEYFHKAIEIARRQKAKSLELRAVMSLSRLWQQQGKRKQARQMLEKIYSWFTEGFDTKDLQEAKALLDEFA
jgi:predicted ATPase